MNTEKITVRVQPYWIVVRGNGMMVSYPKNRYTKYQAAMEYRRTIKEL